MPAELTIVLLNTRSPLPVPEVNVPITLSAATSPAASIPVSGRGLLLAPFLYKFKTT